MKLNKRHAKPTVAALSERTYRKVLDCKRTLLNQMAMIRLDIITARREDRDTILAELRIIKMHVAEAADAQEHMRVLADHCARLLREKETLMKMLEAEKTKHAPVLSEEVKDLRGVAEAQKDVHMGMRRVEPIRTPNHWFWVKYGCGCAWAASELLPNMLCIEHGSKAESWVTS